MGSDHDHDLYIKTEQLIHFRLAFAVVSLIVAVGVSWFAREELEIYPVVAIILSVVFYSAILLGILNAGYAASASQLRKVNASLLALDVVSLTGLVHYTRGVESEIYLLYLLPILLSSYTFSRRGIYATALFVSCCYVLLLLIENASFLPFILERNSESGLAQAYSHRLWGRILARSMLLVGIAFVWARFCQYMSGVAQQGANRLREQLENNKMLLSELEEKAMREKLINSINSALRSTLDLNQIFATAVDELARALKTGCCAIICPSSEVGEPLIVCEARQSEDVPPQVSLKSSDEFRVRLETRRGEPVHFSREVCEFVLMTKSSYEKRDEDGKIVKTFLFFDPSEDAYFQPVRETLKESGISSLVVQPMIYGDESKGVILLGDKGTGRAWLPAELELVKSVAGQVAVAIEHAELVGELSRKNQDLLQKNLNLDGKNIELREMQSQLIHQEKMASLGRLVAGIAHELNNPINFVHGNLPYLREYFDDLKRLIASFDQLPDQHKQQVDDLKQKLKYDFLITDLDHIIADLNEGAERIRFIIRNLRSFSRLDEAELKEASIKEGIESTLKILSQYYGRDKIPVESEYAELPNIFCYPGQLNQVWMNLLSNAAEAVLNQSDARVSVKTRRVDETVQVTISDNGPGIDPAVQSKIFEPFFTTKPVGQGTGLGLSICHSIIERHGGQISCESKVGEGTKFVVQIPLHAEHSDLPDARLRKGEGLYEPALDLKGEPDLTG